MNSHEIGRRATTFSSPDGLVIPAIVILRTVFHAGGVVPVGAVGSIGGAAEEERSTSAQNHWGRNGEGSTINN